MTAGAPALTIAVQAGFIVGTLGSALGNLPDIVVAPYPHALRAARSALSPTPPLALWVDSLTPALVLRFATGLCMAGAYPPAMKIVATWFRSGRGLAIGILVGALTLGSAAPHLFRSLTDLPWRRRLLAASAPDGRWWRGSSGLCVSEGPHRFPAARFDLRMAAQSSASAGLAWPASATSATCGSSTPMWAWIGLFLAASLEARGGGSYLGLNAPAATFVAMGVGGALGAYRGRRARRSLGPDHAHHGGHGAVAASRRPPSASLRRTAARSPSSLALFWGITVIADSAQFSTAVTELCPPAYVGTALTAQTCVGFALTIISSLAHPTRRPPRRLAVGLCPARLGPFLGVLAMARLRALPEARAWRAAAADSSPAAIAACDAAQRSLQRHEKIEMAVGVLYLDAVMPRAGSDENVDRRGRLAGLPAPAREAAGRRPPSSVMGSSGRVCSKSRRSSGPSRPRSVPQLQPDRRTPGGISTLDQSPDAIDDRRLPSPAQAMDPGR